MDGSNGKEGSRRVDMEQGWCTYMGNKVYKTGRKDGRARTLVPVLEANWRRACDTVSVDKSDACGTVVSLNGMHQA